MSDSEEIRLKVTQKIGEVERAVESLQVLRKTLLQKAYETKQSILTAFINERDSMQCKEVRLLGEVDSLHHSKDDAVVIQLSKLNQVLGCLRNCLQSEHPCGECLEKYEDLDMMPVSDISSEFISASEQLKQTLGSVKQAASSYHKMSLKMESEDVMQWLLTPTNVEHHADTPKSSSYHGNSNGSEDSRVTEWLLQYNVRKSAGKSTAAGMGSVFSGVRLDKAENWLKYDTSQKQLEIHTSQLFKPTIQSTVDWLIQGTQSLATSDGNESDSSTGSSTTSSTGSSAISSYVILPSSNASEVSTFDTGASGSWLRSNSCPHPVSSPPFSVSEWLASCKTEDNISSRRRLVSMSSLTSELLSPHADMESLSEWRLDSNSQTSTAWLLKPRSNQDLVTTHDSAAEPSADWLQSNSTRKGDWLVKEIEHRSDWVAVRTEKLIQSDCDMQVDEKHDVIAEKSESSDWLRRSDDDYGDRWLLNQKQKLSDDRLVPSKFCQDKDWLMVVNTMNQICRSDSAGWLIKTHTQ